MQLRDAAAHPDILCVNTLDGLAAAARVGAIANEDARTLTDALRLWHALQHVLRLTVDESEFDPANAPAALKPVLARAAGVGDFVALEARMESTAAAARAIFARLLPGADDAPAVP